MKKRELLSKPSNLVLLVLGILTIITIGITLQNLLSHPKTFIPGEAEYTHYNNYLIFRQSFFHLISNKDLYTLFPEEHWDYYKYSPTFALLMAPLAYLPDAAGLFIWNLLNVLVLFFAIWKFPMHSAKTRSYIFGVILIELVTSIQNSQSNSLIAGLIIFAFISLEKKQNMLASLFIVITIFIKLFGFVALALFLLYPNKLRSTLYTLGWILLFATLPLLVVSPAQLVHLYTTWFNLVRNDHDASFGLSVAGWLHSWFGLELKTGLVMLGAMLFCLPLLNYRSYNNLKFRTFFLASVLIWMVIFNHKAESPTFVIAVSGVSLWFFSQKLKIENLVLLVLTILFTILSPTDIFPKSIRENVIIPYTLKALPCILVWFKMIFDMVLYKPENKKVKEPASKGNLLAEVF